MAATEDAVERHRLEFALELGFTAEQAEELVWARDDTGLLVSLHAVGTLLECGCSHALALRIAL